MPNVVIDPCTAAVTGIECFFGEQKLSIGTGFYWRSGHDVFLITNWHVVTGRNQATGKHISKEAAEPDVIQVDLLRNANLNQRYSQRLPLYGNDGAPLWKEHGAWHSEVDVVALPMGDLRQHTMPINDVPVVAGLRGVGMDVFVIGFPRGIGPERHAIWKRASIASEPDVNVDGLPLRLVDTSTSAGMSGSPVVQRFRGQAVGNDGEMNLGVNGYQMLGVYSGRLAGPGEGEVTLGRVWKETLIEEIASEGVQGDRELRGRKQVFQTIDYRSSGLI